MSAKRSDDHSSPIPWLGVVGKVPAIDSPHAAASAESSPVSAGVQSPESRVESPKPEKRLHLRLVSGQVKHAQVEAVEPIAPVASATTATPSALPPRTSRISAVLKKVFRKKKRAGSGIEARTSIRVLVWVRRVSQLSFFFLFMYWLVNTAFRGSFTSVEQNIRIKQPVEGFLLADPFVALITFLSSHTLYRGLLWSLGLVALTVVFGRVFCGWICPFGTLHHFTAWLFPSRVGKGGSRVEANKTHKWQALKYYLLYAFLAAASVGVVVGGMFDPICVMVRAVGLSVLPATQWVSHHVLGAASDSNVRLLQLSADRTQDVLSTTVFTTKQFYFHQAWFIGALFVAIVFMNRIIPRFWCRALCPLGALLGVMSKFSVVGMEKDHGKCTDCNLCLVHCQGADSPQGGVKHRQDECHMCMNCEAACPEDVIKFRFFPNRKSEKTDLVPERRTALASVAAGAAFYVLHRQSDASAAERARLDHNRANILTHLGRRR
ncbi:MAG: 4Fe-4S binding protein, partial [Deltaproteobacteria bacterium]|nr:4Fe-4S binding protein [Deltaproteobacteria bacterium]